MTGKKNKADGSKEAEQNQEPKAVPSTETAPVPKDAVDYESLWLDTGLGDGITNTSYHDVPTGKPRDFFRTVPDPAYRRRTETYTHKPEDAIDEQHYIIAPAMRGRIDEAQPCTLVTVVYRNGSRRIWPIKQGRRRIHVSMRSRRRPSRMGVR